MLSRTASELYWMARYLERAETIARVLDVTNKLSMMPIQREGMCELRVPLYLTGKQQQFEASYPAMTMQDLVYFFALDNTNNSSIYSCIHMAWNNAHAVRGRLSSEVWESINATWIDIKNIRKQGLDAVGADAFFDWTKERSHLFRGAMFGTLLRSDAMAFIRLGTLIERADSTARLIDVKTALFNADEDAVRNYYRMDMLLRAVSAREAYHSLYQHPLCEDGIIELLILRQEIPRSLSACIEDIADQLDIIDHDAKKTPHQHTDALHHQLRYSHLANIKETGLQPWLAGFIAQINLISQSIHDTYLEAQ